MKAKNVAKHVGKEVVIKVPFEEVTNSGGLPLFPSEKRTLGLTPLTIYDNDQEYLDGDVILTNRNNDQVHVHHSFIKLVNKESK